MKLAKSDPERRRRIDIIVKEFSGINPPFEAFYLQSILYAATAAEDAFQRFARAVIDDESPEAILLEIQEALTHAAGLSRFFWPIKKCELTTARANKLRAAFAMDGSPLKDRELRNALEHFDERLDEFLLSDPVGCFFPGPMVESHTISDEAIGQIFRLVDPYEGVFVILGEKYEFFPIHKEVQRILGLATEFDKFGARLRV